MVKVLSALVALLVLGGTCSAGCPPTYSYSYPSYLSSYYTPTYQTYYPPVKVVKEYVEVVKQVDKPVYLAFPVAVPVYGSMYVPPAAMPQKAQRNGNGYQDDPANMPPDPQAQAQAQAGKLDQILGAVQGLAGRIDGIENRLRAVESARAPVPYEAPKQGYPNPAPPNNAPPPAKLKPPEKEKEKAPDPDGMSRLDIHQQAVAYYVSACASCHESRVAAKRGNGFVLLNGSQKARLSAKQRQAMVEMVAGRQMPPPENSYRIPPPTARQAWLVRRDNS